MASGLCLNCSLAFQTWKEFAWSQSMRQSKHKAQPASSDVTKSSASSLPFMEILSSSRTSHPIGRGLRGTGEAGSYSADILLCLCIESLGVPIRTRPWESNAKHWFLNSAMSLVPKTMRWWMQNALAAWRWEGTTKRHRSKKIPESNWKQHEACSLSSLGHRCDYGCMCFSFMFCPFWTILI